MFEIFRDDDAMMPYLLSVNMFAVFRHVGTHRNKKKQNALYVEEICRVTTKSSFSRFLPPEEIESSRLRHFFFLQCHAD
jgi:hypothetical protein